MTSYRRAYRAGATYFFTVNLVDRQSTLLVDHVNDLREAVRYTRQRHPFAIDAMTVGFAALYPSYGTRMCTLAPMRHSHPHDPDLHHR